MVTDMLSLIGLRVTFDTPESVILCVPMLSCAYPLAVTLLENSPSRELFHENDVMSTLAVPTKSIPSRYLKVDLFFGFSIFSIASGTSVSVPVSVPVPVPVPVPA